MFIATYTHARPDLVTPFFVDADKETVSLVAKVAAIAAGSPGFVSSTSVMSDDKLTNTVTVEWVDQASHDAFEAANDSFLNEYRGARIAYDAVKGTRTTIAFA